MKDIVRCDYCSVKIHRSKLKDHIGFEHKEKVRANKKSGKFVMIGAVVGLSAVIGMIILSLFS